MDDYGPLLTDDDFNVPAWVTCAIILIILVAMIVIVCAGLWLDGRLP